MKLFSARILKFECTSNTPRIIFKQVLSSTAYLILTNSLIYLDLVVRNLGTHFTRFQKYPIIPPLSTSIRFPVCVCVTRTLTVSEMQSEVAGLTCRTCLEDGFHSTGSRHFIPATNTGLRRSRRHICWQFSIPYVLYCLSDFSYSADFFCWRFPVLAALWYW